MCDIITNWLQTALTSGLIASNPSAPSGTNSDGGATSSTSGGSITGGSSSTPTGYGRLTAAINYHGEVLGYAFDRANPSGTVDVAIYIDGDFNSGARIFRGPADLSGPDDNLPGNHRFQFQIPEAYRNGTARQVYVYSVVGETHHLLNPPYTTFYGYTQTEEGRQFYLSQVRPLLMQSCQGGCHEGSMEYETSFSRILTPRPHEGGSKTNNRHINKPATANGEGHGGGKRCDNINSGLCAKLQEWYEIEFPNSQF